MDVDDHMDVDNCISYVPVPHEECQEVPKGEHMHTHTVN